MAEGLTGQVKSSPAEVAGPEAEPGVMPGPEVVRAEGLAFGYPGRMVLRGVDLSVRMRRTGRPDRAERLR